MPVEVNRVPLKDVGAIPSDRIPHPQILHGPFMNVHDVNLGALHQAITFLQDVNSLADGGIYDAKEALKQQLIDHLGYLDKAIEVVKLLAGIDKAQVVEYRKPFSLAGFLTLQNKNILNFDRAMLYELSTPQLLYLWTGY